MKKSRCLADGGVVYDAFCVEHFQCLADDNVVCDAFCVELFQCLADDSVVCDVFLYWNNQHVSCEILF